MENLDICGKKVNINCEIDDLKGKLKQDTSIIYFCGILLNDDKFLNLADNNYVKNMYVVCQSNEKVTNNKVIIKHKSEKIRKISKNALIILYVNDDYRYLSYAISNLFSFTKMCKSRRCKYTFCEHRWQE